jgi:hypothetical protein
VHAVLLAALALVVLIAANGLWIAARHQGDEEKAKDKIVRLRPGQALTPASAPLVVGAVPTLAGATIPRSPQRLIPVKVDASATAKPTNDGCGKPTSYDAGFVQDANSTTAWRVEGDGVGQTLSFALGVPTKLTELGLLPGYAKVDQCTGVDRFPQLRRVVRVRWTFDGNVGTEQTFVDQNVVQSIPVDITTSTVKLEILESRPGNALDFTPISEVRIVGFAA